MRVEGVEGVMGRQFPCGRLNKELLSVFLFPEDGGQ